MTTNEPPTSFCAENMEFIIGMYDVDKSGDKDRIKIRGSSPSDARVSNLSVFPDLPYGRAEASSIGFVLVVEDDVCAMRLISTAQSY